LAAQKLACSRVAIMHLHCPVHFPVLFFLDIYEAGRNAFRGYLLSVIL